MLSQYLTSKCVTLLLFLASLFSCSVSSFATVYRDITQTKQIDREMKLLKQADDFYNPDDFKSNIPTSRDLTLSLTDALDLALHNNQSILEAISSYKQSLLSYQSTLFEFQFSPGTLEYDASYTYQDAGVTIGIDNTLSKTFVNGFNYSLSNSVSNDPDDNPADMSASIDFSVNQQLIGSTYANNINTLISARESLAEAKMSLKSSIVSTIMDITSQFRSVLFDEESLAETKKTLKGTDANIEKSEMLLRMGFIAESELESIKLQKINTQLSLDQQEFDLRQTMNELKVNLGLSVNDKVKLIPDLSKKAAAEQVIQKMLKSRPTYQKKFLYDALVMSEQLISDRISLRSAQRQLKIYYKEKNVTLEANGDMSWDTSDNTGSNSASLSLSLPLDNRSTNNSIQTQKIDIVNSQQQFMYDCIDLIRQESDNYQNMLHYYKQTILTNEQLKANKSVDEASKIRFKYGAISASDVRQNHQDYLNAISDLRQSENDYSNSVATYRQSTNRYIDNMPINLTPELNVIFQTVSMPNGKRSITVPRFAFDISELDVDRPYAVCYKLMNADILDM